MENGKILVKFFLDERIKKEHTKIQISDVMQRCKKEFQIIDNEVLFACGDNTEYEISLRYKQWEKLVYGLIKFSQKIGKDWICLGNIKYEFDFWTNTPFTTGVKSISIVSKR